MYNLREFYSKIQRKHLTFLPKSPITSMAKKLGVQAKWQRMNINSDLKFFDGIIKKEFDGYSDELIIFLARHTVTNLADTLCGVEQTNKLEGDILELGVQQGNLTVVMAKFLKTLHSTKKIYSCDTFTGIPYDDQYSTIKDAKGMYSDTSIESVQQTLKDFDADSNVELIKGKFEDTLENKLADKKFSFIFVDCDIYKSTVTGLNFGYPRLVSGGIIMFDDYDRKPDLWGQTKAVDDFCQKNQIKVHSDNSRYNQIPYITKQTQQNDIS